MGIIEEIKDMDYDELVRLRGELDRRIYEKAIMRGYKDGFKDGQKSERDRMSLLDGKIDAKSQESTNTIDYRRAFKIACTLLNGDVLYGVDRDKIFELMTQKDGVVSNSSYEEYILSHLQELDKGQYASNSEISNKLENSTSSDDCISRADALRLAKNEYLRGWHDALSKALSEKYSIHCEEGIFSVIQEETIKGLGLSMDCALSKDVESYMSTIPSVTPQETRWIPCSERMPKEREWPGTKRFGTTISDEVYVTLETSDGKRFCDHIMFQNGKIDLPKQAELDLIYNGTKAIAWMPLPKPFDSQESEG